MLERLFHLNRNQTTVQQEILSGLTVFLSMMYVLFANSSILSETGMPWQSVFAATALSAAVCTAGIAVFANLPFGIAPGMGMNSLFAYTICISAGYHWQEALAIAFLAGILHVIIMLTRLRKAFVNAFPEYLRVASGVGLGMFIAYIGVKNSGLLVFSLTAEPIAQTNTVMGDEAVPGIVSHITTRQMVAIIGLLVMVVLTAREKKTGERFAALPIGILVATFIGIPFNVTQLGGTPLYDMRNVGASPLLFSFFGETGLFSIFSEPLKAIKSLLMIFMLFTTGVLDSVGTMIGVGQIHGAKLFDGEDMEKFAKSRMDSRLDRSLIANSFSNMIPPLLGASPSTIYLESVTGIASGGRTGLSAMVISLMFLLCLPFSNVFQIIPGEAIAPALILAGVSMLSRMRYIDWRKYEESLPAFITILIMPLAHSILDGIALGILCHVAIQTALGKGRDVHPLLYVLSALYIAIKLCESLLY